MTPDAEFASLLHNDMKTSSERSLRASLRRSRLRVVPPKLVLAFLLGASAALSAADTVEMFVTPEEAVAALAVAVGSENSDALRAIFGPAVADLQSPDRVQAANELKSFASALNQTNRLVRESESRCVLELGENFWPFPVPLVKQGDGWFFDTAAGKDELLNRRIGGNELSTLQSVRAYVAAQREYAAEDRDGDQVLEFAQKFRSSAGTQDGLYWPPDLDGEISPLGPLVAQAQNEGYGTTPREESAEPQPFHGYFFKILTRQAKSAPGGKYDYLINGNMIGGFALVAWPAEYGQSGIMTFIVNQQGRVYQADLGPQTAKVVEKMKAYDPGKGWSVSPD